MHTSILFAQKKSYRQYFTEGNFLILEDNYKQALKNFVEAYKIDSVNSNINFKVGFCYLKSSAEKNKAAHYFEKAVKSISRNYSEFESEERKAPITAYYYLGISYHINYQFDDAIAAYGEFKKLLSPAQMENIKKVERQIEISKTAKEITTAPVDVKINNLEVVNSEYPDYSPVISADEKMLVFTSRREGSSGGEKTVDDQFYEDIYVSYKQKDNTWTTPENISSKINTIAHEATVGLSMNGQELFIYKGDNGGDIYDSKLEGFNWTTPTKMGSDINTPEWETSATISADGNALYFVSDRSGGLGGRDIWKSVKLPNGKWSLASNLGAPINSADDEESPFLHPNGTKLYFSSTGHKNMGGFDVYYSELNPEINSWSEPQNVGYPINTTDDDLYYVISPDGKRAYFSSSRKGGMGEKDIYVATLNPSDDISLTLLKGEIITDNNQEIPNDVVITMQNTETGNIEGVYKPIRKIGTFVVIIPSGKKYHFSYTQGEKEFYAEDFFVPENSSYKEIEREVPLHTVTFTTKANNVVNTANTNSKNEFVFYFDYNQTSLDTTDEKLKSLINNVAELTKANRKIKISIAASASHLPTKTYKSNEQLALERAETTKYIVANKLQVFNEQIKFVEIKSSVSGPKNNLSKTENKKHQNVIIKIETE